MPQGRLGRPTRSMIAALLAVLAAAVVPLALSRCTGGAPETITVMTRNVYLGGDITRPVRAAATRTGSDAMLALGHANADLRTTVQRTDFGVRGRLLAAEIAAARPDLVGLQAVALWRSGPVSFDIGRPRALEVDADFLSILLAELSGRGVPYDAVAVQQESDVEAPSFRGPLTAPTSARNVRLTDRDVILLRRGAAWEVRASGGGNFRQQLSVDLAGQPYPFVRGYAWVDVVAGRHRARFLTTHLESQSSDLALAQARELADGPAASTRGTTILVGDVNSDPASTEPKPGSTAPRSAAYQAIRAAGFADAWLEQGPGAGAGYTSGLSERVDDVTAGGFTRRLDLVLVRAGGAANARVTNAVLTGHEPADRDSTTGLWPSDHAGRGVGREVS